MPRTLGELVREAASRLESSGTKSSRAEAIRFVRLVTGASWIDLEGHPERVVEAGVAARFDELLRRRLAGEPLQYLLGEWEFFGRPFFCDPRALIPRPETELIVELFLEKAAGAATFLDLGTGTGILAVTAALERPAIRVTAVDLSPAAAALAAKNARRHGARLALHAGDWDSAIAADARFDVIVSNPPYVDRKDEPSLPDVVRLHEPALALYAPGEPLSSIRSVVLAAERHLSPGGFLFVEIGAGQGDGVREILESSTRLSLVEIRPDLAGIPRALVARSRGGW